MAESTLTLTVDGLRGDGGSYLGWSRDASRWSAKKLEDLNECLASTLRKFYFQASVRPQDPPHQWTFLRPVARIHLVSGEKEIPLPDDFGGFEGRATIQVAGSSGGGYCPIEQFPEERIRALYAANDSSTGRPAVYADTPRPRTTKVRSSRSNLLIYPIPDQDYQFYVPYSILPDFLTIEHPYPYGGAGHAETLKAGMRAACELYEDGEAGEQTANYLQCLAASIQYDRRHQPKTLGVNSDLSDGMMRSSRWPEGLWHPLGIGYLGEITYQ